MRRELAPDRFVEVQSTQCYYSFPSYDIIRSAVSSPHALAVCETYAAQTDDRRGRHTIHLWHESFVLSRPTRRKRKFPIRRGCDKFLERRPITRRIRGDILLDRKAANETSHPEEEEDRERQCGTV